MKYLISPVTRTKLAARGNYNRLSRWYDLFSDSSEAKYRQMGIQLLALQSGEQVLEIGFGTGHCLSAFAKSVAPQGWVCGIDLSDGMAESPGQGWWKKRLLPMLDWFWRMGHFLP
jgi:ubiquinone/menaquinone biosynthesis C-methylase UbiE